MKIVSPGNTVDIIKKYNLKLSKKYGQNFLIDENVLQKIIRAGELTGEDLVLEVGSGIGTLTQALVAESKKVVALEIDDHLIPVLKDYLKDYENLHLIHGDVLRVDLRRMLPSLGDKKKWKVISNLPYNITTPLIMKLLTDRDLFSLMVLMVQREVGERITASPGGKEYGAVTVLIEMFASAEILFKVSPRVFIPPPEVESVVVRLKVREQPLHPILEEEVFCQVVRGSFQHRRKSLLNSLEASLKMNRQRLKTLIIQAGIDPARRGETLTAGEFANLSNIIYNNSKDI
ncbi:MAG: 16S rRNA (adenine(1518)-N(6)/adenine(1519)-N(6))-dimethyltransferase RsmA [Candidatus Syntrophonatronum acetioxidans]|uniref:Ribosomal RNA small subunit methyltransferase A n=1 Tax=Candidatus Syntrophonatronum acetioxidans TaxID=1795816 RepID=A0A424YCF2_9FIRM|nr:MAG: 16S rRNA (adenine(1518)-N(6)/adenine(1519)-N(6))-dimethyltransferase RsmA [Candidatus Syntrophonatronum acetioxidans]